MESGAKREGKRAKQWGSESSALPFQSTFICLITFVHEPVVALLKNMGGGGWDGGLKASDLVQPPCLTEQAQRS